jgi:hypothetical protein
MRLEKNSPMQKTVSIALAIFVTALLASVLVGRAEMGPCEPDGHVGWVHEGLTCGKGVGAARIIDGTLSPDKSLALGWRASKTSPAESPSDGDIELLVVRIATGEILFRTEGRYWDTGTLHVSREEEHAVWSPDSRLMIENFNGLLATEKLRAFAFDPSGAFTSWLDLTPQVRRAVVAFASRRIPDAENLFFWMGYFSRTSTTTKDLIYGVPAVAVDNDGHVRMTVHLWAQRHPPVPYFDVVLKVTRVPKLTARVLRVTLGKKPH